MRDNRFYSNKNTITIRYSVYFTIKKGRLMPSQKKNINDKKTIKPAQPKNQKPKTPSLDIEKYTIPTVLPIKKKRGRPAGPVLPDALRKYQQDISCFSLLKKEEEIELARRYRDYGDMDAFNTLVVSNLRLVIFIANKYRNSNMDFSDLIQEGNQGLIKGLERFDPDMGSRVSTYVTWWIRQSIVRGIAEKSRTIRVPVHINEKLTKINKKMADFFKIWHHYPSAAELSGLFEEHEAMTPAEIENILAAIKDTTSIDAPTSEDNTLTKGDKISDPLAPDPLQEVLGSELKEILEEVVKKLPDRERYVIEKTFGLKGNPRHTLEHIGSQMEITRERVRQLKNKALKSMRENLIEKNLEMDDFLYED